jgi:hypothetical protein
MADPACGHAVVRCVVNGGEGNGVPGDDGALAQPAQQERGDVIRQAAANGREGKDRQGEKRNGLAAESV